MFVLMKSSICWSPSHFLLSHLHHANPLRSHEFRNKVEAAYRCSDLYERRCQLMNDWAAYLAEESRDPEADPVR